MTTISQRVEDPLLAVLLRLFPHPTVKDAMNCLKIEQVQDAAVRVAERARQFAIDEDERRRTKGGKDLINYRGFYVGAVGIGLILSPWQGPYPYTWFAFAAFNTKPSKKARKYCAEKRLMRGARKNRCTCLGGLAVSGELQPDGRSGIQGLNLDPCGACRDDAAGEYRSLFRNGTLLLTAQPGSQFREVKTMSQLMEAHGEKWPQLSKHRAGRP
ncbi:hypothetical protein A2761_02230 [Candidatus Kaiserbacteria bacterium RIFCSPHIGHO2_01_FULL_51_33]|uniref:CMP/dCMP-type deaminase domain-containing protein n=1 Tax=Candidatus Kaiserbacteria bacterium RIFCSPLOWO2_01_FULL_51_21 TaxID=1798508 RepID=A0A1F6EDC8_9BACT|nr:MAG: hypothetical protein A2761_02230 [Candidatus Kaiserbacteria bacterium RIFCSPHIGHO2_01_FULL_51_33]OGG71607.1 MAG: hypothetical protein A3A35_00320 [Candidatus Kaiserbacteria bacterium RIFCSPLOWO2_01_FULL_51_21]